MPRIICIVPALIIIITAAFGSPISPSQTLDPELGQYFEGDIMDYPKFDAKAGIADPKYRWPNARVGYSFGPGFTSKEQGYINLAMATIASKTCVRFYQTSTGDRVVFTKRTGGCSSYIGRIGGPQQIYLDPSCFNTGAGTTIHETIHALGFYHEQSRPDRDNFVQIQTNNIKPEYLKNFNKHSVSQIQGTPYDYGSIMHYPKNAFAKTPSGTTIQVKGSGASIGQRTHLSAQDAKKINNMYGCA